MTTIKTPLHQPQQAPSPRGNGPLPAGGTLGQPGHPGHFEMVSRIQAQGNPQACPFKVFLCTLSVDFMRWVLGNRNYENNRRFKPFKGQMFKEDMLNRVWHLTHQGVAFSEEGWLIDGQNRFKAAIEADLPLTTLVFLGVPTPVAVAMDNGTNRSVSDACNFLGLEEICHKDIAVVGRMIVGPTHGFSRASNQTLMRLAEEHAEALAFTRHAFGGHMKKITVAPVMAVVARAWYTQDKIRLAQFADQLKTGQQEGKEDIAVVKLRNFLLQENQGRYSSTTHSVSTMYRKTQRALRAFLDREPIGMLYEASRELFPLPGELQEAGAEPDQA